MDKHAYLITAYNNFYILEKLLCLLDDERNDIYIHMDKKAKNFDINHFSNICKHSKVVFMPRIKVYWGDYTQIQSIINLLEKASDNNYKYYHLLSGVDLPIKTQNYIHEFFSKNDGKEFVGFTKNNYPGWVSKIHIFNKYCRTKNVFFKLMMRIVKKVSFLLQSLFKYDKTKKYKYEIKKGSDWFSISDNLVKHIIANKKIIKQLFKYAYIPTEFYVHTLLWNSKFKENIYDIKNEFISNARYIDWHRGDPYVFRVEDFDELVGSDKLFARKFDEEVDRNIVDKICHHINGLQIASSNNQSN